MIDTKINLNLFNSLTSKTIVISPNRRLAATLSKRYQTYQIDRQQASWPTADILPYQSFLQRLWLDYTASCFAKLPLLLSPIHEQVIWETIIAQSKNNNQLLQITETADICKSAFTLLRQWQLIIDDPLFKQTEDSLALYQWSKIFLQTCAQKNWIDNATLPDLLNEYIKQKQIAVPEKIILIGFTEINPQMQRLLNTFSQQGCIIETIELQHANTKCYRLSFNNAEDEILAMARWAKSTISKHTDANIGCVIPNLDKVRDRVVQLFEIVFKQNQLFNISAGKPLSEYPIIHAALQLLALHRSSVYLDAFSYLLLTPFMDNGDSERIKRAKFDVLLRRYNVNRIDIKYQLQAANSFYYLSQHVPQLATRLEKFYSYLDQLNSHCAHSEWAHIFTQLLTLLGWPGERSLNSEEYQTVSQWLILLNNFSTLDNIAEPVNLPQALSTLNKIARRQIFQPKSPDAPIQVLGLLEAAGLTFDYLWVASMDDMSWPPQPKPNPLLPKKLQRELQMPHASAERELKFSQLLTQQFKQSAQYVFFSHAEKQDEIELQASPLIKDVPEYISHKLLSDHFTLPAQMIFGQRQLTYYIDTQGPQQTASNVLGGVNILKQQALCPFKAFAEWRLYAREIEQPLPGLRNKDRGTILHKALEIIWGHLRDQQTLLSLNDKEITSIIDNGITQALATFPVPSINAKTYLTLETIRLKKLIFDWLAVEKDRQPFTVVAHEQQLQMNIQQLHLTIKIDRIDKLADGKKIIIDYKTGSNNDINHWLSTRPEEPQLPLYALHDTENIIGITFAQITPGNNKFIGLSRYDIDISGIRCIEEIKKLNGISWDNQLQAWQQTLTDLSTAFCNGQAQVDPKDSKQTCMWCQLQSLCRINEELAENYES